MVKIFFMALLMSGCTLENWELDNSVDLCKNHKGIDYINIVLGTATCNDGKAYYFYKDK